MNTPDQEEFGERLEQLEEAFDALISHVEDLTAAVTTANTTPSQSVSGNETGAPWLHDQSAEDSLAGWVGWFNDTGYVPAQPSMRIPDCWAKHPGLIAELTTVWWSWKHAFRNPRAEPEAAQNWHDRWLPGVLHRIRNWVPPGCLNGQHRDQTWTPPPRG